MDNKNITNEKNENNISYEENKKATIQAWVSIILLYAPIVLFFVIMIINNYLVNVGTIGIIFEHITNIFSAASPLAYIIGLVLMIDIRVKYPKNKTGKIAMLLYIITTILIIIVFIFAILFMLWAFCSCVNGLQYCPS